MKRFNIDGNLIPTESRSFSCGSTRIDGEVGNGEENDFYLRISNSYLSNIETFASSNRSNGEDYCFIRGKGKEEKENIIQCLKWIIEKMEE